MPVTRREFLQYGAFGVAAVSGAGLFQPRPARAQDHTIVRAAIHPAIGVARIGNSPTEYFIGPEVPGLLPPLGMQYKDGGGRILRQAARFRVYGLDAEGRVVRELTAQDAGIRWTVHLANRKAAWYDFDQAFDIPESASLRSARRNPTVSDRSRLVIDPGPRTIGGIEANWDGQDPAGRFDTGRFFDRTVPLGDIRTDERGRLLVLGGFGNSADLNGAPAVTFANNQGWHDDISDGPVDATVRIGGREIPVEGAWAVVAPPNYGPGLQGIVTMYDVIWETATRDQPGLRPPRPSFTRQIYPILERHVRSEWVNAGFFDQFGWGAAQNFLQPGLLATLASSGAGSRFARTGVFRQFRNPDYAVQEGGMLPPYYGDAVAIPPVSPRQWMAMLPVQYQWLQQWADGDFEADWRGTPSRPGRIEALPLAEQPGALDRAALDDCLGGPFHPGCEMTWPMRVPSMYAAPFRLRHREGPERDYGDTLTAAIALGPDGPLTGSGPGDVSRWMAVPWQTDTSSCLSAYIKAEGEYLPTFWPARVPNDVLTWDSYRVLMDPAASRDAKEAAFQARIKWLRDLPSPSESYEIIINRFIAHWGDFGVIARHPGPGGAFPAEVWVETGFSAPEGDGTPAEDDPLRFNPGRHGEPGSGS